MSALKPSVPRSDRKLKPARRFISFVSRCQDWERRTFYYFADKRASTGSILRAVFGARVNFLPIAIIHWLWSEASQLGSPHQLSAAPRTITRCAETLPRLAALLHAGRDTPGLPYYSCCVAYIDLASGVLEAAGSEDAAPGAGALPSRILVNTRSMRGNVSCRFW